MRTLSIGITARKDSVNCLSASLRARTLDQKRRICALNWLAPFGRLPTVKCSGEIRRAGGLLNVKSSGRNPSALARAIRYLDFDTLVLINKEVVSLTQETHEYDEDDEKRMKALLRSVKELMQARVGKT